ncbi:hypothetical protein F9L07_06555 [Pimelobacter simplex]|uniref:Uncharacterized protein n=1 Tax=Nocardioides simplex TaxID=2045 RepID=A0A7J5E0S2_NOCSI|nr:hypothetical protein F9L07_06555 [Pimelobacter simplex]
MRSARSGTSGRSGAAAAEGAAGAEGAEGTGAGAGAAAGAGVRRPGTSLGAWRTVSTRSPAVARTGEVRTLGAERTLRDSVVTESSTWRSAWE